MPINFEINFIRKIKYLYFNHLRSKSYINSRFYFELFAPIRPLLLLLVVLSTLLYSSSVVSSWCVRVELVEVSIYRYLLLPLVAVLSSAVACVASCGCIACLLSALWYPCRSCGRLVVSSAVGCICCGLVVLVACRSSYRAWSGHRLAPVGTVRRPDWRPSGGGGDFSKRGERQTETNPVPIFMREVEKNVVFQRKTGENGENLRKRKRE